MLYDDTLTDDEWRELNFTDDVIESAVRMGKIASASRLIEYADQYGPDGVLESAIMLGQSDYRRVEKALREIAPQRVVRRRRRR